MTLIVAENGETFEVIMETETDIYFYDENDRWCYFQKNEEGKYFTYVKDEDCPVV